MTIRYGKDENGGAIYANIPSYYNSLVIENCKITENINDDSYSLKGSGGIIFEGGNLEIKNSVISNNRNLNGECGGIYYNPISSKEERETTAREKHFYLINTSIYGNESHFAGAGLQVENISTNTLPIINIENCTFSNNFSENGLGNAICFGTALGNQIVKTHLKSTINSCTFADNFSEGVTSENCIYLVGSDNTNAYVDVRNSLFCRNQSDNIYFRYPIQTLRSYTISDDNSIPICSDPPEYNNYTEELITGLRNEEGTYFYKIIAGSLAKDAIPKGDFSSYPYYNGAGEEYITADNDTTSLDQRGFIAWNQAKDIGAYESPYYWVDVPSSKEYQTIPNWRTKLTIADPIEYATDTEHEYIWTDYMRAQEGGRIILSDNSEIIRYEGCELYWNDGSFMNVEGDSRIRNGSNFIGNANVNILDGNQLTLLNSNTAIPATTSFKIGNVSKFVLEGESAVTLSNGLNIESKDDAEISLYGPSSLNAYGVNFNYTGTEGGRWEGIYCGSGSTVNLDDVEINNAETGLSGLPMTCSVKNSTFTNCISGISVEGCDALYIANNILTGTGVGTGISVTQKSGYITENTVSGFRNGIMIVSCAPHLTENTIFGNTFRGLYVAGLNAIPTLIKPATNFLPAYYLNNEIVNNGTAVTGPVPTVNTPGQICVLHESRIYMQYGQNNVYSTPEEQIPDVPCMVAAKLIPEGEFPRIQLLNVQGNYWGASAVNDNFFVEGDGYSIEYYPYHTWPWGQIPSTSYYPVPDSKSFDLLMKAFEAELNGKYDKAIHFYEKIIEKYPDSDEAYVAYSKLPDNYNELDMDLEPLISLYDSKMSTDENNRKFFKEMKVATRIKGKKFDEAISISEEMKLEADTEEEEILCDIDITIATLLKNDNKGRSVSRSNADAFKNLYAKLSGDEIKNNPSDISETVLPSKTALYQNYPNPFNPVTQIKFNIGKTGNVKLTVYNITGQKVAELENGVIKAGTHSVEFDGSMLNSGLYYYTLEVNEKNITRKMVLTK